ncbi:E3 ubiquitin-protein ligase TRIM56-like [Patiria miniata]|uniref:Uncharacterized protein n=1 Tax=Patiria miniata TaxID=46514 RepID=A0A914ANA3_PATMI|nr:E3 ubiquitin-protein ligase TRIM56-like [Patiria miniata]
MATAISVGSAFKKIGVHLECSICTDKYKKPKVLDCLHSFCEECLVKYRDGRHQNKPKIPCPVCRQETALPQSGIQGLKTNFHLVGLIEEFELQEKVACSAEVKLLCQVCDKGNEAKDHCMDCEKNICMDCCKIHQQFPTLKNHIIASFDDIRQGKVSVTKQPDEYKCPKHKEGVKFYCKTCDKLICQGCTVIDHPTTKHFITDTGTASREYRQSLKRVLPVLATGIRGLKWSLQNTITAKKIVKDNTAKARKGVQGRAAEVIAQVKAEEKRLLDEITTQERKQNERLDEHEKTLSNMMQIKKHSLQTTQDVASNASDCDLLSLYPVISKDVAKLRVLPCPKAAGLTLHPVFVQNQKLGIDLGKVMVEDTWDKYHSFGNKGSGERQFEGVRGIAAAADPYEIAVADCNNKRVVICNSRGQTKSSIPIGANDVVAVSNQWVCADPSKVMVYNRDTKPARDFDTLQESEVGKTDVWLMSAAVMPNGNIMIGDGKRKVLTELNPRNGEILHTMSVKTRPAYLTVLSNGWIVISDDEEGLVETVEVSDGNAVTVCVIKPTIGGKPVKYCRGVCSNSSGIYLAVMAEYVNTGHIHHYNCAGQFVSCVVQGLYCPGGITFTADGQQLVVADLYSIKIYHKW